LLAYRVPKFVHRVNQYCEVIGINSGVNAMAKVKYMTGTGAVFCYNLPHRSANNIG
jgi:hypothetical protein